MAKRRLIIAGAVVVAVIASVAAIGVPAGWYGRAKASAVVSQPARIESTSTEPTVAEAPQNEVAQPSENSALSDHNSEAALAAKRQHDKEKAKAREEKAAALTQPGTKSPAPAPANGVAESAKPGPKKVAVTVTYDESGRVTQASGADATALRIARQKRFPAGKGGSTTLTIPIN